MPQDRPDTFGGHDLEGRLDTMKRELDALQIHVMKDRTPWYKQGAVAISVVALAFSAFTHYTSEARIERQDRHAARAELRSLIQRLQALPRESVEISRKYKNDPDAHTRLLSAIATERHILGQQAVELVRELKGDVTATEYYAIVDNFLTANQHAGLEELVADGLAVAKDAGSEVTLLRQAARLRFSGGDPAGGRAIFAEALKVFEKYPGHIPAYVALQHAQTHARWAAAERTVGDCVEAWRHITLAQGYDADNTAVVDGVADTEETCGPKYGTADTSG
jgi:hypothetical protein